MTIADFELRVVSGAPDDGELAALTAVLRAATLEALDDATVAPPEAPSSWQRSQRGVRGALRPGPGAWRDSGFGRL